MSIIEPMIPEWRPATLDDAPILYELARSIEVHDADQERTTEEELRRDLTRPWIDLRRDSLVGIDPSGNACAYGLLISRPGAVSEVRASLFGGVAPGYRNRGIGTILLERQLARGRERVAEIRAAEPGADGLPAGLRCYCMEAHRDKARLYRNAGMAPVRYSAAMRRRLRAAPDPEPLPGGVSLAPWDLARSEPVRLAHNSAFADHWGSQPHTEESWRSGVIDGESFRPELSVVALGPDGETIGYALNSEYEQDWEEQGYSEGYTDLLGVIGPWRGRGIATALLAESARLFHRRGHPYAGLDVDTANSSGAGRLYESLGYEATHRSVCYELSVN